MHTPVSQACFAPPARVGVAFGATGRFALPAQVSVSFGATGKIREM
jgi:hypothetical protein